MRKMIPNSLRFAVPILLSLCSCASLPPAPACKPLPLSVSAAVPLPPPVSFSKCLREILAVGRGTQAQISADCSKLLQPAQTK